VRIQARRDVIPVQLVPRIQVVRGAEHVDDLLAVYIHSRVSKWNCIQRPVARHRLLCASAECSQRASSRNGIDRHRVTAARLVAYMVRCRNTSICKSRIGTRSRLLSARTERAHRSCTGCAVLVRGVYISVGNYTGRNLWACGCTGEITGKLNDSLARCCRVGWASTGTRSNPCRAVEIVERVGACVIVAAP
jgi:hypothetical protein